MSPAARPAAAAGGGPARPAVPVAVPESQPGQPTSGRLARAALRSALEQCPTWPAIAAGAPDDGRHLRAGQARL
jgi:hypothetical protein